MTARLFETTEAASTLSAGALWPPVAKRILVADDDNAVRTALCDMLQEEGYAVDQARDGTQAVSRVLMSPPDLVLLDLNMPRLDGWQAFCQFDHLAPLLPVIVITARPNQYPQAVSLGVDAFMEKPLSIPNLLQAIRELISEPVEQHINRITHRSFVTRLLSNQGAHN